MGGATKHHNFDFNGGSPNIPEYVGDRYFGQDRARDFWYQVNKAGEIGLAMMLGDFDASAYIGGGSITVVDPTHIDIPAQAAVVVQNQDFPDDWTTEPPTVTSQPVKIPMFTPDLSNQLITGATLDGSTVNYIKIARAETEDKSRIRAKTLGTYTFEKGDSYTITYGPTAPTSSEVAIATFIGDGSTFLTVTQEQDWYDRIKDTPRRLPTGLTLTFVARPISDGLTESTYRLDAEGSSGKRFVQYQSGVPLTYTLYEITDNGLRMPTAEVGSITVSESPGGIAVCLIDDDNFVTYNTANNALRWYRNTGGTIAQVGNTLTTPGGSGAGTCMTLFRGIRDAVILTDNAAASVSVYSFDGTDFTQEATIAYTSPSGLVSIAYMGMVDGTESYILIDDDPGSPGGSAVIQWDGASLSTIVNWNFSSTAANSRAWWSGFDGYIVLLQPGEWNLFKLVFDGTSTSIADFFKASAASPISIVSGGPFASTFIRESGLVVYTNASTDTMDIYRVLYSEFND
jgi:hypothetical protein